MSDVSGRPPPPVAVVVTSPRESDSCFPYTPRIDLLTPAWARDEPPSPTEQIGFATQPAESRIFSDASSLQSNRPTSNSASRWWSFTLRTRQESFGLLPHSIKPEKKSVRDTSLAWMPRSSSMPEGYTFIRKDKEEKHDLYLPQLQISVPTSAQLPNTAVTPGWDIPWTSPSQLSARDPFPQLRRGIPYVSKQEVVTANLSKWSRRKKQIRSFIIANTYAPLVRLSFVSLL
jgi:hypothetical protein